MERDGLSIALCIIILICFGILIYLVYKIILLRKKILFQEKIINEKLIIERALLKEKFILQLQKTTENKLCNYQYKNTEPYSGLFTKSFIYSKISEQIIKNKYFNTPFSCGKISFNKAKYCIAKNVKNVAEIIQENISKETFSCYDGFSAFYILFPNRIKDDIEIFFYSTIDLLESRLPSVKFNSCILQYSNQVPSDFIEAIENE